MHRNLGNLFKTETVLRVIGQSHFIAEPLQNRQYKAIKAIEPLLTDYRLVVDSGFE